MGYKCAKKIMKKLFLTIALAFVAFVASAANWHVTVKVQKKFEFVDSQTHETVSTASGGTVELTFDVVADSKYNAEREAVVQCSGVCENGTPRLVASKVRVGNRICDKYEIRIVGSANAVEVK